MNITSQSLTTTAMERMKEKYGTPNPEPNTWMYNHRLEVGQRKIKWEELKAELNKMPANYELQIRNRIEKGLVKTIKSKKTGETYNEYTFFIKGWECALVWKKKERQEAYYEAWNSHDGLYYRRDLLEIEMQQP
jgi:hypothetical protein